MVKGPKSASFSMGRRNSPQVTRKTAEFHLLVPLNKGRHAYVHDPSTGSSRHAATDSDTFIAAVTRVCAQGYAARVEADLAEFAARNPQHGWDATAAMLRAAGALDGPA